VKSIIAISDLHIGSTVGLCSADGASVTDGGHYKPNKFQATLWRYWLDFWGKFVPRNTIGSTCNILVINGDIIDGVHHQTVNLISNSWEVQEEMATKIIRAIPFRFDKVFVTRGTEAHADIGAQSEERIAKAIGCEANEIGEYSSWQQWLDVDGVIFQFAHTISTTSSAAYESSAPMREMVSGLVEAAQWGRPLPSVFVRSHRHRFIPVSIPTDTGRIWSVITPGWQLRTPFVERIDRMRMPHIGGVVFKVEDKTCQVLEKIYKLPEPRITRI
jgi:hypothetical protein